MVYENDKLNIPEKYRNMSVSEIRIEKERIYAQIKRDTSHVIKSDKVNVGAVSFKF